MDAPEHRPPRALPWRRPRQGSRSHPPTLPAASNGAGPLSRARAVAGRRETPLHAQLGRRVAGLLRERRLDVLHLETGMPSHDLRRQCTKPLVTLAIELVAREGETG